MSTPSLLFDLDRKNVITKKSKFCFRQANEDTRSRKVTSMAQLLADKDYHDATINVRP